MNKINYYVINLDYQKEQYKTFKNNWEKYFNIIHFSAVDSNKNNISGKQCCKLSHLNLMKKLVNECDDEKFFIVMEDDVYPTDLFDDYYKKIMNFICNDILKYDFIHFDIFLNFDNKKQINIQNYNEIFLKYFKGRNMGFMIYNSIFLKKYVNSNKFDDEFLNLSNPLDMRLTYTNDFIKITPNRLLVRQYTNKKSTISENRRYTQYYDNWYDETDKILINYNTLL